ncbi:MAG: hypothetical protein JJ892_13825 [Balneola sp.]|nr:hypothetical protein [Balneola sp.]MBO6651998.1 hypothetical protein [Balneola sp.]MBO6712688.1 hypothetical protein [Balneola sp.]MBO6801350.1 hypothetical protein [Balneola sp.]MBO6870491.1 hypothetical protein [Balneola sp.]
MRLTITFIYLLGLSNVLQAQNPLATQPHGINIISDSQYQQIKYNGYTIDQLNSVADDQELLTDIFGNLISKEISDIGYASYTFSGLTLGYSTQYEEDYISGFTATSRSALTVKVLGESIRVGDSFDLMKQKFGSDVKIKPSTLRAPDYILIFDMEVNEWDGLLIYFDASTNQVKEITYFINP